MGKGVGRPLGRKTWLGDLLTLLQGAVLNAVVGDGSPAALRGQRVPH